MHIIALKHTHTHQTPTQRRENPNGDRWTESTYFIPGCLSQCVMNTDGSRLHWRAARPTIEQLLIRPNIKYFVPRPRCPWKKTHGTAARHIKPPETRQVFVLLWARNRKILKKRHLRLLGFFTRTCLLFFWLFLFFPHFFQLLRSPPTLLISGLHYPVKSTLPENNTS